MRYAVLLLLALAAPLAAQSPAAQSLAAQPRIALDTGWTVRAAHADLGPIPATVPGVVHTDLHRAGRIPDPFFGDNERRIAWVDTTTWVYETTLAVPAGWRTPALVFEGLDTIAEVRVDGETVLRADNAFRRWSVPLAPGAHRLAVVFHPAAREAERRAAAYPVPLPENPRPHVRKPAFHFGWDWGPRFVTAGIWKPVYLEDHGVARLGDVYARPESVTAAEARYTVEAEVHSPDGGPVTARVLLDGVEVARQSVPIGAGAATLRMPITIPQPRRWWPRGLGEAYRYRLAVEVDVSGHCLDAPAPSGGLSRSDWGGESPSADPLRPCGAPPPGEEMNEFLLRYDGWLGVRAVRLDTTGGAFAFVVNDVPVFAKGANLAPLHSFYPVPEARYRAVLGDAAAAGMNMVRVWGGGVYEDDAFYTLADSLGLMVWQDFMFGNAMYPGTDAFRANVRAEAHDQVRRLRGHPSVVLWCGGNEIREGWFNWGWQDALGYTAADSLAVWRGYEALFEGVLPEAVEALSPSVPYWPSSPSNGWGRAVAYEEGDVHYWGVWWGRAPFETYREKVGRFNSEYGFQAYPVEATVRTFADTLDEANAAFRNHQKHPHGFDWLREYARMTFGHVPDDPGRWRYMTQAMQAEGVGMAVAGHRAAKPRTMGTLYWQLNDPWPVVSWSSVDYYGRWKPLHYRVRDLYPTLFAEVYDEDDHLRVRVVSDSLEAVAGTLIVEAFDTRAGRIRADTLAVSVPANGTTEVDWLDRAALAVPDERLVIRLRLLDTDGRTLLTTRSLLASPWKLDLAPPDLALGFNHGRFTLTAQQVALGVWLEGPDGTNHPGNYLDLFPGDFIRVSLPDSVSTTDLTIRSLYDLRAPR